MFPKNTHFVFGRSRVRGYVALWCGPRHRLQSEEIIGKYFSLLYGEGNAQVRRAARDLEICLHNGSVNSAGWRYGKDGGRFWAIVLTIALYKNDIHIGFGQVACDRTEQREAEMVSEAAMEEHEAFNCMFRAKVSHDVRTLLHDMLAGCSFLLHSSLTRAS